MASHAHHSEHHPPHLAHHFETLEQQYEASTLGMWLFLVTEVMLFGGLFAAYVVYRYLYPDVFAEASHHNNVVLGTINTVVLIVSSVMAALGVHAAQMGERRWTALFLALTALLGTLFLGIKGIEYYQHFHEHLVPGITFHYEGPRPQQAALFFLLYFMMTGLHAIHMVIGIVIILILMVRAWRGAFATGYYTPVELGGLYWHLIDIVWVFLFPLLYLIGRHG